MSKFIPDYPSDVASQIEIAHRAGTTSNGCFCMKMHPWLLDRLLQESSVAAAFPMPVFVQLFRQDILKQAISHYRSEQTQRWHFHMPEEKRATYSGDAVDELLVRITNQQKRWQLFFARNGIRPLAITYEDLIAAPYETLGKIASLVGVEFSRGHLSPFLSMKKQSDGTSREWEERFVLERGGLANF
jgi:LPS sulfotransferase NodH